MKNLNFLPQKYSDLPGSKPVERAVQKKIKAGEKGPQTREGRVDAYLERLERIMSNPMGFKKEGGDRGGFELLKHKILEKYVTKYEEIPKGWHDLNERILRERGQGGDWERYSEEQKEKERRNQAEAVLADQEASLEQWIDYLASPDSAYTPNYIKYWTFRNIINLSEYDKEKSEFPKRAKGTVKMFPDINHEALSYVIEAILKKQKGEKFQFERFEADLTEEQKEAFQKGLETENFAKLYAWANEQIHPIAKHLLPVTEGVWIKYDQDSDGSENYKKLNQAIRGRGTGWCTAGENTAKTQLQGGDFYCYYTLDDDGKPAIPRIAIRMEGGKIAEVRGIAYKQNLDPYMGDVLAEKLNEFPDKNQYLKKDHDMKTLTEIENKTNEKVPLTKDDLSFLYEVDSPIEGFGYGKDPRIEEIRNKRDKDEDMSIIFECAKEQIAHSAKEIKRDTKAYVGELKPGIFDLIQKYNIEHIYTSFPEGKILKFETEIGGQNKDDLIKELEQREKTEKEDKIFIYGYAKSMLKNTDFHTLKNKELIGLVKLKVSDLGFPNGGTIEEIYRKAEKLGLELCPPETGPQLRLHYEEVFKGEQQRGSYFLIAMKQISDSDGSPSVFRVRRRGGGESWLSNDWAGPTPKWDSDDEVVFRLRK